MLWAGVSALALGAAVLAPQAASAANFTAATEAQLQAAIAAANASADTTSTIQLTQAITLTDPSALPVSTKPIIIIDTNGFALDNLVLNGAPQVNLIGGGLSTFSTTSPSNLALLLVSDGEARILAGAHVTTTNLTNITGNGILTVDGGRLDTTQFANTAIAGTSTVSVVHGGVIDATTGTIWANGPNLNLTVADAGSRLHVAATTSLGGGLATITVSNGGTMAFDGRLVMGTPSGASQHSVTVTDPGSSLTVGADLGVVRGTLNVLAGGRVTAPSITMGGSSVNQSPTMTVSSGGVVDLTGGVKMGQVLGNANLNTLILNTGGALNAGGVVTVGFNATKTGNLVIGGVGAAQAAGALTAAGVALTTGSGALTFNHTSSNYAFNTPISGGGVINHTAGDTHLTGDSSAFTGATHVTGGTLSIDGKLGDATATLDVQAGATLGGSGIFGGNVTSVGGTIAPGNGAGTLAIGGNLTMDAASTLNIEFGQSNVVGGPLNDLIKVGGALTLDGTLNVTQTTGGVFDVGLYRIASYGTLNYQGLVLGTMPGGATASVQTAIDHQVNLVNTGGLTLNFWDGDGPGASGNSAVDGGSGTWTTAGTNWTVQTGAVNSTYAPTDFVIFAAAPGTVNVGTVTATGMQFAVDGYHLTGGQLTVAGGTRTIRVGDGTDAGKAYVAVIDTPLTVSSGLTKTDLGTLVLNGDNAIGGTTRVQAGTLLFNGQMSSVGAGNAFIVSTGATIGGTGTIRGGVVAGTLAPGGLTDPGTLTVGRTPTGNPLTLNAGSELRYRLGQAGVAGGPLNDLLVVNGNLTLNGTLNVTQSAGGIFGQGVYRLIDYTGTLTDNVLDVGSLPSGFSGLVQTSVDHQVNLVVSVVVVPVFSFWDGDQGVADDGHITGGGGVWRTGSTNWATADGLTNGAYADDVFAVFTGAPGMVIVDASGQPVRTGGMQFAADGYSVTGGPITVDAANTVFRVGDGTTAGAAFTATIASELTGAGGIDKTDAGTLVLTGANTYAGSTRISGGTLAVDGSVSGSVEVTAAGRLTGIGTVGEIVNRGVVAPGHSIGVLTVAGDYVGAGGTLEMEAELGGDASAADRLVVHGATSGDTLVDVKRVGGTGAATTNGILLVQVDGASDGVFTLANGDYKLNGENVLVAGAYGYVLRKDATDGDWSLRSSLIKAEDPTQPGGGATPPPADAPAQPLYQAGAPLYEAYPQTLQLLNSLDTLRQRTGTRQWSGQAVWGRFEGGHSYLEPASTTTQADLKADRWKMEFGADQALSDSAMGGQLTGGITAHYGEVRAKVASPYGGGHIDSQGWGVGTNLTWTDVAGGYVDAQAQFNWFDSDLSSDLLGRRAKGANGDGYALSVEAGKSVAASPSVRLTPQAQLSYAKVGFDAFTDSFGAQVSDDRSDSLRARLGLALDHAWTTQNGEGGVYGLVNVSYEFLDGTRVDVSGTPIASNARRAWTGLTAGGNYAWGQGRFMVYGEASADTSMTGFGDSYDLTGSLGFRLRF